MVEIAIVNAVIALVGGTAGVVVIGSAFGAWMQWKQTREFERQTVLLSTILFEMRLLRRKGFKHGSS